MRTRGWAGNPPATDEEAAARILAAAKSAIDRSGDINIAEVARAVGVTRQTVYTYYPSTEWLLVAAALDSAQGFLDDLAQHVAGITDPAEAIVVASLHVLDALPDNKYIGLLLNSERGRIFSVQFTSDTSLSLAHSMLYRFDVDWAAAGFTESDIDELAEQTLRILQSFMVDRGHPPRESDELRGYLDRWLGAAVRHRNCSPKPPRRR